MSVNVEYVSNDKYYLKEIIDYVNENFDLSPKGIINFLDLKNVKYYETAKYGHFTNQNFNWERV